jgi:ketosteroid isomerase-like protein
MSSHRGVVEQYFARVSARDFAGISELRHEDFVQEWPQMKERTVGKANARAINENHPGLPRPTIRRLLEGEGFVVAETTLTYGDGSVWDAVSIFELRDGLIVRQTDYFGAPLPAPAWRAKWVERMT